MTRMTPAAAAATLASLALATSAQATTPAPSGEATISPAYQRADRCVVDVQAYWRNVRDGAAFQVNVDGRFVVERLIRITSSYRPHGETVDVGAWGSGKHLIRVNSVAYDAKLWHLDPAPELVVDCATPPEPEPRIVERTVERVVERLVPVPTPPAPPVCRTFAKTLLVTSHHAKGHRGASITRVDVWVDGELYDRRTASAKKRIETRRMPLTGLECKAHTFRVTASLVWRGRHFTRTVRGTVAPGGLNRVPVKLATVRGR